MSLRELLQLESQVRLAAHGRANPRFKKLGESLMNQQCWCWGCDIRRTEGNLLLDFGFCRQRPPADTNGSTCYRIVLHSGHVITLWGFGVLIEDRDDAIHVGRFDFDPRLCPALGNTRRCWTLSGLGPLRQPSTTRELTLARNLCAALLSFISEYESWISETVGLKYRQKTVNRFEHSTYSAAEAKELWPTLAKKVARHYGRRVANRRIN